MFDVIVVGGSSSELVEVIESELLRQRPSKMGKSCPLAPSGRNWLGSESR